MCIMILSPNALIRYNKRVAAAHGARVTVAAKVLLRICERASLPAYRSAGGASDAADWWVLTRRWAVCAAATRHLRAALSVGMSPRTH